MNMLIVCFTYMQEGMEQKLQESDCQDIVELLSTSSEKWRSIGLQLGLPTSTLNKVGELSNSDPVNRLSEMISEWLKKKWQSAHTEDFS